MLLNFEGHFALIFCSITYIASSKQRATWPTCLPLSYIFRMFVNVFISLVIGKDECLVYCFILLCFLFLFPLIIIGALLVFKVPVTLTFIRIIDNGLHVLKYVCL